MEVIVSRLHETHTMGRERWRPFCSERCKLVDFRACMDGE
ncbi:MAG: DNA gyrase inhibitor YacG [Thermodesulfobacteriota bacterium]